jgi:hypothetical protein
VVPENKLKRFSFSEKNKNKPVLGFWDGWIWTDEMSIKVGSHYGLVTVIRRKEEEYYTDYIDLERQGEVTIMFWAAICYGIAPSECPFFVWEVETKEEKEKAQAEINSWNEEIDQHNAEIYQKLKEKNQSLPKGERHRGRLSNQYRVQKKRRSDNRKGGIDWYRYKTKVLDPLLYPFYDKLTESHRLGERGAIHLMEDGAGPHRASFLNFFRHERGINKVDWPPCKFLFITLILIINVFIITGISTSVNNQL